MVSKNSYCRSCGIPNPKNITELKILHEDKSLQEILYECTGIDIKQDIFSRVLCKKCKGSLISSYRFRRQTQDTHTKLIEGSLQDSEVKQEFEVTVVVPVIDEFVEDLIKKENEDVKVEVEDVYDDEKETEPWSDENEQHSDEDDPIFKKRKKRNKQIKWSGVQCPGCRISVRLNKDLKQHLKDMEGDDQHIWYCEVCTTDYKRKHDLYGHIIRTHKENACHLCNEIYKGSNDLQRHMTKAHYEESERQDICPHCGKLVKNIRSHIRDVHKRLKKFGCDMCDKKFVTRHALTQHFRVHSDERPYKCSVPGCDKAFKLLCQVKQHQERHGPKGDCVCDICGLNLASKYSLVQHKKTHFNIGTFKCDECNASFSMPNYLKKHKKNQHGTPLDCSTCGRTFKEKYRLKAHMKLHDT